MESVKTFLLWCTTIGQPENCKFLFIVQIDENCLKTEEELAISLLTIELLFHLEQKMKFRTVIKIKLSEKYSRTLQKDRQCRCVYDAGKNFCQQFFI